MADGPRSSKVRLHCAIYTRKSSEEGLEQAFNSLDAQREACEAYIASQRHEGWFLMRDRFDDGGLSGGTMERPALQRLLAEIVAGRIDAVVVYKVDRLTRALGDFARIVELFDRHKVSFVSVTQAFNTTTSMGRLTLNVLLSFAQFEREVTGERIRDKIAASKKKGLWMGGRPALGYDVRDRKLVVNDAEAETVRHIFNRYCELRSVRELRAELDAGGIVSKVRSGADGSPHGGKPLLSGALYAMLQNRLYLGETVHKGTIYPGEHAAIVDQARYDAVQGILATNRTARLDTQNRQVTLLKGLLYDSAGQRLTPSHTSKKGARYRYYISHHLVTGSTDKAVGLRLPATGIEGVIVRRLGTLLADPAELVKVLPENGNQASVIAAARRRADVWTALKMGDQAQAISSFVERIDVLSDHVSIAIHPHRFESWIVAKTGDDPRDPHRESSRNEQRTPVAFVTVPARLQQRGQEQRLVFGNDADAPVGQDALVRLLSRSRKLAKLVFEERASIQDVARAEDLIPSYVTRLLRLSFLAPDIVDLIIAGRQHPSLTATQLMVDTRLPLDWTEQRKMLSAG